MNLVFKRLERLIFGRDQDLYSRTLDENFDRVSNALLDVAKLSKNFVDATSAAKSFQLPDGFSIAKDFFVVKTDSSGNVVTVTPYGTQTIEGSSTLSLAAQYSSCILTFYQGVWYRLDV